MVNNITTSRRNLSPPYLDRHLTHEEIEGLKPLQLPLGAWQGKLIPVHQGRQDDSLFQIRNVPTNAPSRPRREWDEVWLHPLPLFYVHPPVGLVLLGVWEDGRIVMRSIGRH